MKINPVRISLSFSKEKSLASTTPRFDHRPEKKTILPGSNTAWISWTYCILSPFNTRKKEVRTISLVNQDPSTWRCRVTQAQKWPSSLIWKTNWKSRIFVMLLVKEFREFFQYPRVVLIISNQGYAWIFLVVNHTDSTWKLDCILFNNSNFSSQFCLFVGFFNQRAWVLLYFFQTANPVGKHQKTSQQIH